MKLLAGEKKYNLCFMRKWLDYVPQNFKLLSMENTITVLFLFGISLFGNQGKEESELFLVPLKF